MKKLILALAMMGLGSAVYAADQDFTWTQEVCTPTDLIDCSPITGYQMQRKTATGTWQNLSVALPATARSFRATGLVTGIHTFRVLTLWAGEPLASNEVVITVSKTLQVPVAAVLSKKE